MKTLHSDPSKIWTVEKYLQLEETKTPCELIHGELIMSPRPTTFHQRVLALLCAQFENAAASVGGMVFPSLTGVYIDKHNVFEPDILYVSPERTSFITMQGIMGPPDLVVEILSPSNSRRDKGVKKQGYLAFGVLEYWIVDPIAKSIFVYTPVTGEDTPLHTFTGDDIVSAITLPTLTFALNKIFPPSFPSR